jgi:UDPglucose 6-dehydrogenase
MTEWKEFVHPDFDEMRKRMKSATIFDGRNLYEPKQIRAAGFAYHSIGRAAVSPA